MIYSQQRGRDRIFRLERGDRMGQQTSKKVKFVGTEQFINTATGELTEMQVTSIEDRDFNFTKIWMKNFIATMDIVGNQKTRFCYWIIDHLNRDNILIGTQRKLSEKSGISLQTVNLTMKLLMDADFLRKQSSGVYIVNPDIVFKGTKAKRMNILNEYSQAERIEMSDEEKLNNLLESIKALETKAQALERTIREKKKKRA